VKNKRKTVTELRQAQCEIERRLQYSWLIGNLKRKRERLDFYRKANPVDDKLLEMLERSEQRVLDSIANIHPDKVQP